MRVLFQIAICGIFFPTFSYADFKFTHEGKVEYGSVFALSGGYFFVNCQANSFPLPTGAMLTYSDKNLCSDAVAKIDQNTPVDNGGTVTFPWGGAKAQVVPDLIPIKVPCPGDPGGIPTPSPNHDIERLKVLGEMVDAKWVEMLSLGDTSTNGYMVGFGQNPVWVINPGSKAEQRYSLGAEGNVSIAADVLPMQQWLEKAVKETDCERPSSTPKTCPTCIEDVNEFLLLPDWRDKFWKGDDAQLQELYVTFEGGLQISDSVEARIYVDDLLLKQGLIMDALNGRLPMLDLQ